MAATDTTARKPRAAKASAKTAAKTGSKAPAKPRTRKPNAPAPAAPVHDAIARRAYELHEAGHGDELANWLQAERELAGA